MGEPTSVAPRSTWFKIQLGLLILGFLDDFHQFPPLDGDVSRG
jgi:hypothetical protein